MYRPKNSGVIAEKRIFIYEHGGGDINKTKKIQKKIQKKYKKNSKKQHKNKKTKNIIHEKKHKKQER